jgi:hypothetical protein
VDSKRGSGSKVASRDEYLSVEDDEMGEEEEGRREDADGGGGRGLGPNSMRAGYRWPEGEMEDGDEGDIGLGDLTEDDEDQDHSEADIDGDTLDGDQPDGTRFQSQTELVRNFAFSGTGGYGAYILPEHRHTRTSQQFSSTCTYTCVSLY